MTRKVKVGQQTIFFGSSKLMSGVKDESVDFFITSPPYWNLKDYGASPDEIGGSDYESYLSDLADVWAECYKKAKPGAVMIVNVNSRRSKGIFYPLAFDIARTMKLWNFWDHNIWYIPNALPQPNAYMERLLDNKFESLLVFIKGDSKSYKFKKPRVKQKYFAADPRSNKKNAAGRCLGNILRIPAYRPPTIKKMNYHVAAFPEEMVSFFLATYTVPGDVVLDPFVGSGTTLKAASVMDRKGIGYEVHDEFEPLIRARIAEEWSVPAWESLDIIHSASSTPGMQNGPRRPKIKSTSSMELLNLDPL